MIYHIRYKIIKVFAMLLI
uniref:Uncharacterized protein n=1 Tax=Arundo donax TaxID=35708 RepID=A0A0A9GZ84_ARUDO